MFVARVGLAALVGASCADTSASGPAPGTAPPNDDPNLPGRALGWGPGQPGLQAQRATGQAEVGEALRVLETTGEACDVACPALLALRLGVKHLCTVTQTKDDAKLCKDVRGQLLATEKRLRPSCGTCAPPHDAGADASEFVPCDERPIGDPCPEK